MKKRITLFAAIFCYFLGYSQMSVKKTDGTEIHDGDVFTFNTVDEETASLKFAVYNTSSNEPISAKIECTSISNSDGQPFQFCFGGYCYFGVYVGLTNPGGSDGYLIAPGGNSGDSDHFWNLRTESTTGQYPMEYKFKIYMTDPLGNETGDPVNITYRYTGALAVNDAESQNILTIKNTVVSDILNIESKVDTNLQVVDFSGKVVYTGKISKGSNVVNLQNLTKGSYIVNAGNKSGKSISTKIIKK